MSSVTFMPMLSLYLYYGTSFIALISVGEDAVTGTNGRMYL